MLTFTISSLELNHTLDSPLVSFAHGSHTFPQLFHSKLKTLHFSNTYPYSSSSPCIPHLWTPNTIHHRRL